MMFYLVKLLISALLIVIISEVAKRSSIIGAVVASLPLTSLLAMIWLYADTGNAQKVAALSGDIFWLILPTLSLFIVLPVLIRHKWHFYYALSASVLVMLLCYGVLTVILSRVGVKV